MRGLQPQRPASKLQYLLRAWCLVTASWYLVVTLAVVLTGGVDVKPVLVVLVAFVLAAPVVFAAGCLAWPSRAGWIARCLGLVMMVVGFVPLAFFSAVLIPFVFFSLPAAWRWRSSR